MEIIQIKDFFIGVGVGAVERDGRAEVQCKEWGGRGIQSNNSHE